MLTPPSGWNDIVNGGDFTLNVYLIIEVFDGATWTVTNSNIELNSCVIEHSAFSDLSIGNACSAMLKAKLVDIGANVDALKIGQKVELRVGVKSRVSGTWSASASLGVFFIASIDRRGDGCAMITAYDGMSKLDNVMCGNSSAASLQSILNDALTNYGLVFQTGTFYSKTRITGTAINASFSVPASFEQKSVRKLLENVAALSGSNLIVNRHNYLAYCDIGNATSITDEPLGIICTAESLNYRDNLAPVTSVRLASGSDIYDSGTGYVITGNVESELSPTIAKAKHAYSEIEENATDSHFSDVQAQGVYISPLFELGDIASIRLNDGTYFNFRIMGYRMTLNGWGWAELMATRTDDAIVDNIGIIEDSSTGWSTARFSGSQTTMPSGEFANDFELIVSEKVIANTSESSSYGINPATQKKNVVRWPKTAISFTYNYYDTSGTRKSVSVTAAPVYRYLPLELTSDGNNYCVRGQRYYMSKPSDFRSFVGFSAISGTTNLVSVPNANQ